MYDDLREYLGEEVTVDKCKTAVMGLAWEWYNKTSVLDYYRDSKLYVYDLTYYQGTILGERFYDKFRELLTCDKLNILDLGGGIGEYTIQACKLGHNVDYVDVDGYTKDYALWRFKKHGVTPNIYDEDFKLGKYDLIIAMDVLEHLEEPEQRIKEFDTRYLLANPDEVKYNDFYPQHISRYDLTPYFEHKGWYLWQRLTI